MTMAADMSVWQQRLTGDDVARQLGTRPVMVLTQAECELLDTALKHGWDLTLEERELVDTLHDRIMHCSMGYSELERGGVCG